MQLERLDCASSFGGREWLLYDNVVLILVGVIDILPEDESHAT